MPSVRYMNSSAPFWDFVASMEQQGQNHPFFARQRDQRSAEGESSGDEQPQQFPFGPWQWPGFGQSPWSHRGRGGHSHHHRGPPPPPGPHAPPPPPPGPPGPPPPPGHDNEMRDAPDNGEGPSNAEEPRSGGEGGRHHGCHGRRGGRGRGGWGGPWGGRHGGRGGFGGPFGLGALAQMFQDDETPRNGETKDFEPEADVFDTESSFVVHVSLPGAKKEDVGVNWDAEKSELSVAGVIYRPGDEEFLKTLALNERKVGPFERKIRLGTRANPAQVDADYITAKLEDGILRIEVPKLDKDFVEIRKVDIE